MKISICFEDKHCISIETFHDTNSSAHFQNIHNDSENESSRDNNNMAESVSSTRVPETDEEALDDDGDDADESADCSVVRCSESASEREAPAVEVEVSAWELFGPCNSCSSLLSPMRLAVLVDRM